MIDFCHGCDEVGLFGGWMDLCARLRDRRGSEVLDAVVDEAVDGYVRRLEGSMICCAGLCRSAAVK